MNSKRRVLLMLLILLTTLSVYGQSSQMFPIPNAVLNDPFQAGMAVVEIQGTQVHVLYFTEQGWQMMSNFLMEWHIDTAEKAIKEAVSPLLIENAGLEEEVKGLRLQARAKKVYQWGFYVSLGVAAGSILFAVLK